MVYVKRELETQISRYLKNREIIGVVGVRQCGKTTLISNMLDELKKKGKRISKISFDNVKDNQLFENDIDSFVELYVKDYDCLFIDEVQYSNDSGKKLKYIYDNFKIKIFISGSSAAEISIQSLKYLVGRIFIFKLYPFNFAEFLSVRDKKLVALYKSGNYKENVLDHLNKYLYEFILYGGYPTVVLSKKIPEKITVLQNIYNTYLLKEIRDIMELSHDYKLINLMKALSLQIGNIINYNELSGATEFSYRDIKKHLTILEKTFICNQVTPFYKNKRTELVKSPKIYFFDLGFRNICINNFSQERSDLGSMYENFLYTEFVKKDVYPKYWHTKSDAEVDFIIEQEGRIIPVEIKSSLTNKKVTRSFHNFIEKYNPKEALILSLNYEGKKKSQSCNIRFKPFLKLTNNLPKLA